MELARRLALLTVLATLVLIGVGVLVRATGSGLGCPDWPTCHGGVLPPGNKHPVIEMSHRFTATAVGLLVIAVAVMAWRYYRDNPFILWTAIIGVPLVGFQGLLGAITVVKELPPEIVASHLLTAMIVLSCQVAVAAAMYMEDSAWGRRLGTFSSAARRRIGTVSLAAIAWLAVVLWVGGYMTESGASTACDSWPGCTGAASLLPASNDHEVTHMLHRYLAAAFLFFVVAAVIPAWRQRSTVPWAALFAVTTALLYALQVVVGALNVWYTFPNWLAISHTVIASLIWTALSAAVMLALYVPAAARDRRPSATARATA
ncbi:MAG: COX15/CtaA family protein [Chloroflexi bacterium]|nr:COX15/CtaA family protein [Chloroflexota bacterium]